ncbi:MAG: tetratricopeptide repeat protein [Myxococcota bacterium]
MRFAWLLLLASASPALASPLDDARAAAKAHPKDANVQYDFGLALMKEIEVDLRNGKLSAPEKKLAAESEKAYLRALELAPDHGRAHIMLGMLYNFTAQYEKATPHLVRGMTLPKGSQDWWIAADTLVNVYFNQSQPAPAAPILEQIVEARPKDAGAHYKLGLAYLFTGRKPQAAQEFKRTLELEPDHGGAKKQLAALE